MFSLLNVTIIYMHPKGETTDDDAMTRPDQPHRWAMARAVHITECTAGTRELSVSGSSARTTTRTQRHALYARHCQDASHRTAGAATVWLLVASTCTPLLRRELHDAFVLASATLHVRARTRQRPEHVHQPKPPLSNPLRGVFFSLSVA